MDDSIARQTSGLLGATGWFEDFTVGLRLRHARSSTIGEAEGSFLAKQVMNTAQAHWNDHQRDTRDTAELGSGRLVFGLATAATVLGLAFQDTTEHALAEVSYDGFRFRAPVHHGDTLTAYTEVLDIAQSEHPDAGLVTFKHWGLRQDDVVVFEGIRTALIKRRSHWGIR
ncbi:MaoC family dehydratase [Rhizohabitans arisaemae]|uniref:MaoC family dehydratase n=1 Tax=Rhizohabitans arisaemae TaxID=2720610 RepID=UPI0024B1DCD0|nr:MaoC family dehydratase [Rhizohabitans arisaemae]